jgi:hypothetical protein
VVAVVEVRVALFLVVLVVPVGLEDPKDPPAGLYVQLAVEVVPRNWVTA